MGKELGTVVEIDTTFTKLLYFAKISGASARAGLRLYVAYGNGAADGSLSCLPTLNAWDMG